MFTTGVLVIRCVYSTSHIVVRWVSTANTKQDTIITNRNVSKEKGKSSQVYCPKFQHKSRKRNNRNDFLKLFVGSVS